MSEQSTSNPSTIATGTKVKDPRRVAAGKRLAAISRQAKEAKRSEREAQRNAGTTSSAYVQEGTGDSKTLYLVGGLLVVGAASYLLLTNKEKVIRTFSADKEESDPEPTPKRESSKRESFKSAFDD